MSRTPRALLFAALLTTAGLLGACGDDGEDVSSDDPTVSTTAPAEDNGLGIEGGSAGPEAIEVTGPLEEAPTIELNDAGAVTELYTEDVIAGDGDEVGPADTIQVQYTGIQLNGVEFDSSWSRGGSPAEFSLNGVIPGFAEGLTGATVGSRRLLVIPEELAYAGGEPAGTLVFVVDVVAITIEGPDPIDVEGDGSGVVGVTGPIEERPVVSLNGLAPATELVSTDVLPGDGAVVEADSTLTVQYLGTLLDGTVFDETWDDGLPVSFDLDGVIDGWQQGLVGMQAGGRRLLVIPPDLAYGSAGNGPIGPDETLVFVIDVIEVS